LGEEEVPNMKCMCVGEEEVSLLQPITVVVPPEEEEVPVLQAPPPVTVLLEEGEAMPSRGLIVTVDDEGLMTTRALYLPWYFSTLLFFLINAGDSSRPSFFLRNIVDL
jgi:hypothetical protein